MPRDMCLIFFFKQKTAYELRISDWSSDVCSSDLGRQRGLVEPLDRRDLQALEIGERRVEHAAPCARAFLRPDHFTQAFVPARGARQPEHQFTALHQCDLHRENRIAARSEEHTSELQSLMRISYAVFCLKKKTTQ